MRSPSSTSRRLSVRRVSVKEGLPSSVSQPEYEHPDQRRRTSLLGEVASLTARLYDQRVAYEARIAALKERLGAAEAMLSERDETIQGLRQSIKSAERRHKKESDTLQACIDAYVAQLNAHQKSDEKKDLRIAELERQVERLTSANRTLTDAVEELSNRKPMRSTGVPYLFRPTVSLLDSFKSTPGQIGTKPFDPRPVPPKTARGSSSFRR